ncbi:DUF2975 domain-containing protein [Chryseobacterium hagamense]|uniref:DUF2975 domain-containing protein n=1 Tax=Chryseobacterium hagamense TaxID=395935 RepID=A0A511YNS8_9FLAO|nr:DUF2975 domain-containing protein [Chryseobacterium hagamense]GEN76858.1 hypothetical protein CHA01nite_25980 [Chryseobacterium hagamense]
MKIIGKNSLSQYISYLMLVLFILFALQGVYQIFGWSVLAYNFKTGNNILSDLFILGTDVGWSKNQWTQPLSGMMKFKIFVPFTDQNLLTGLFNIFSVIHFACNSVFVTLFCYTGYKFLKEISQENVFNARALSWLKKFGWINILYAVVSIATIPFSLKTVFSTTYSVMIFLFFGILVLFIVEFFRKGLELQEQVDLTI